MFRKMIEIQIDGQIMDRKKVRKIMERLQKYGQMDRKIEIWIDGQKDGQMDRKTIETNNGLEQKRFNFKPWKRKTNKLVGRNILRIIRAQNIQGLSKQTTST